MSGFLGAVVFLLVTGTLTLLLAVLLLRGLARGWKESRRSDALARQEGWRHLGGGSFIGPGGSDDWRGGARQDDDRGDAWTDFAGRVTGLHRGGYLILPRSQPAPTAEGPGGSGGGMFASLEAALDRRLGIPPPDAADQPGRWPEITAGSPAFQAAARVCASDPCWAAIVTPEIEALWWAAHPAGSAPVRIEARRHHLSLFRDDGHAQASVDASLPLLRLGAALLVATRNLAARP